MAFPAVGGGLDLVGDDVGSRLKNVMAKHAESTDKAACGTFLIDSANKANSVLLKKVKGAGPCGDGMPDNNGLSAADQQCLSDWVNLF